MENCPKCKSSDIKRKEDSHWIISLRRAEELQQLTEALRIVFVLFDRTAPSLLDIRVRAWEIWPSDDRCAYFIDFITDYHHNNYLAKRDAGLDPASCNLHPLTFDNLMMNPVKILDARIDSPDQKDAKAHVDFLFPAEGDRANLTPEPMPPGLLTKRELPALRNADLELFKPFLRNGRTIDDVTAALESKAPTHDLELAVTNVPWQVRRQLPMREKRIKKTKTKYRRRRSLS
jgi:hypothetical protein